MQPFGEEMGFPKIEKAMHPILVKKFYSNDALLQKFLQSLYFEDKIEWISKPHLKEIETYVLFHLCAYGEEEIPSLKEGIKRASYLLENPLGSQAHILIIIYRDFKVSFPERKLQREKFMSELVSEEVLRQENSPHQNRIRIIHEFGINNLQKTLQETPGNYLYFEMLP